MHSGRIISRHNGILRCSVAARRLGCNCATIFLQWRRLEGKRFIPISAHVAAFQLLMALSIGATLQIRSRRYSHYPKIFFQSAIDLSSRVFGNISLPSLQSILLVVVHSLIDPGGCDVWTLTHIAMAYAVDLWIHREASASGLFSSTAIELHSRVFFCVYSLDR